jgi:hypothetical protein
MRAVADEIRTKRARQSHSWNLLGTQRPAPPAGNPQVTPGAGSAVVRFRDSGWNFDAGPINRYIVTATPVAGGAAKQAVLNIPGAGYNPATTPPSNRAVTVTGLQSGAAYDFRIQAQSQRGIGSRSLGTVATITTGGGGGGGGGAGGGGGYIVLEQDGDLFGFGTARALIKSIDPGAFDHTSQQATETGIVKARLLQGAGGSAVAVELTADKKGFWVLRSDGVIMAFGNAPQLPGVPAGVMTKTVAGQPERVAALARLGNGRLWVFTTAGRVVPQGGALPAAVQSQMNSILGLNLLAPIVDAKPTMDGTGVVAMATDGGIFTYNAPFLGSVYDAIAEALKVPVGSIGPDRPVVGVTMDPDGDGYWVVAEDGGVFTPKSRAPFRGSLPAIVPFDQLFAPVNGMVPFGNGYLLVAGDGGVFNFSNLGFSGSASGLIDTTAVGIAPV